MSEVVSLIAQIREEVGTGASRSLRKKGMVPATIYGTGNNTLSIAIEEKEITKYYRKPQYMSQVFQLEIGSKKHKVLPKDIQLNPITDVVSHADFIFLGNKMQKMKVPVVYLNNENSIGVKRGGYSRCKFLYCSFLSMLCPSFSSLFRMSSSSMSDKQDEILSRSACFKGWDWRRVFMFRSLVLTGAWTNRMAVIHESPKIWLIRARIRSFW